MTIPSTQTIALMEFQRKNFRGDIPTIPHIGFIKVRTNGVKRARKSALPIPYFFNHFSVAATLD
jgi:hypothetical protein